MKPVAKENFLWAFRWKKLRDNSIKCPSNYQPTNISLRLHSILENFFIFSPTRNDQNELNDRKFINYSSSLWLIFFSLALEGRWIKHCRFSRERKINIQFSYHNLIGVVKTQFNESLKWAWHNDEAHHKACHHHHQDMTWCALIFYLMPFVCLRPTTSVGSS